MRQRTHYRGRSSFLIGLATGALGAYALRRMLTPQDRLPYLGVWQRVLAEQRGEAPAALIAGRAQSNYRDLYAARPRFSARALQAHLDWLILPGLALYRALREGGEDQESALAIAESLFQVTFAPLTRWAMLLDRTPDAFALFRWLTRSAIRIAFPSAGWEMELVQDGAECLEFRNHHCIYLDVLTAYDAPELTALYCKLDDLMFQVLPPGIAWQHQKTLARGDDACEFRWCHVPQD